MSIEPLLRSLLTTFFRLHILLILFASSACMAEEGTMNIRTEFSICPAEDTDEVVSTLRLKGVSSLTVTQLREIISDTDYSLETERYGISREACSVDEISPDTEVLVITAWFDPTNTYFRHFYILTDETGVVTQIELRKVRLGP